MEELPEIRWTVTVAPGMDRRDQLRLYRDNVGLEATKRQVRLTREALAREAKRKPKAAR